MSSKIYFANPVAQLHSYKDEILQTIARVCEHGPYVLGPEVKAFEKEFADYIGAAYCVGVGSGTDALMLAMRVLGIGPGDEVITVSHTALATVSAILMVGATPVLIDIEPDYYTMDPKKISSAVTSKTKAIIPVHLYGQPCEMGAVMAFATEYNLKVIEDCAQAHGAMYQGKKVGSIGDVGCFSFYPTKNLGALGDGGGITFNDPGLVERLKQLRQYGWNNNRIGQCVSAVTRLDEIQAAILRLKLKYLDQDTVKRQRLAKHYDSFFRQEAGVFTPLVRPGCEHVYHLYVIQVDDREACQERLQEEEIYTGIHYKQPIHFQPGYCDLLVLPEAGLPVTEKIASHILSLPMYPEAALSIAKRCFNSYKKLLRI